MTNYEDLIEEATAAESVFADKSALDPLAEPDEIAAREDQERELIRILNGVTEGYLPVTVSVYGPPGTGKTLTVRRTAQAVAAHHDALAVEYVNLKECRSLFSAANEIHLELVGEKLGAYQGLDGVFEGIWSSLEDYPEWTVLILDEIDHIQHDTNYEPSDFFYRLLRGEGKLKRGLNLSVFLISNQLLEVDLRLDSRVRSAIGDEEVFFPPYGVEELAAVLHPRLERAFVSGAMPASVRRYGIEEAAARWGDARKGLTLFRRAGETANADGLDQVNTDCIDRNLGTTDREIVVEQLLSLPEQHFFVLQAIARQVGRASPESAAVTTSAVREAYNGMVDVESRVGQRAMRNLVDDLETMGLVEAWTESRGRAGRVKRMHPTFDPAWALAAYEPYLERSSLVHTDEP